jgi:hypothetical protein
MIVQIIWFSGSQNASYLGPPSGSESAVGPSRPPTRKQKIAQETSVGTYDFPREEYVGVAQ